MNKLTDIDRYGREGRIDEEYKAPYIEPFKERDHLRSWLGDAKARDQFALYRGDTAGVFWNNKRDAPENVVDRPHWTQLFVSGPPRVPILHPSTLRGCSCGAVPLSPNKNSFHIHSSN